MSTAVADDARQNQFSLRSCGSHVKTFSCRGRHCWERMPEDTEGLVLGDRSQQSSTRVLLVSRTCPPTPTTGGCLRKDHLPTAVRPTATEGTSKATHCHLPRLPKKVPGRFRTRRSTCPRTRKKRVPRNDAIDEARQKEVAVCNVVPPLPYHQQPEEREHAQKPDQAPHS